MISFNSPKAILKEFSFFSRDGIKDSYYLFHYKRKSCGHDDLTRLLFQFKDNKQIKSHWAVWATNAISTVRIKGEVVVIRALASNEITVTERSSGPLDAIGRQLKQQLGFDYIPSILYKAFATKPLKECRTEEERWKTLSNAYRLHPSCPDLGNKTVLIIDDVKTFGVTFKVIAKLLKERFPNIAVVTFALGLTNCGGSNDDLQILSEGIKNKLTEMASSSK